MHRSVPTSAFPALAPVKDQPFNDNGRGVTSEQLAASRDPSLPVQRLIGERYIGRPYQVWKNDLDLARRVNEQLALSAGAVPPAQGPLRRGLGRTRQAEQRALQRIV